MLSPPGAPPASTPLRSENALGEYVREYGRVAVRADLVFAGEVLGTCVTRPVAAERSPRFGDEHGRQGWLSFPLLVRQLPPTCRLVFTLYGEKLQGGAAARAAAAPRQYAHASAGSSAMSSGKRSGGRSGGRSGDRQESDLAR